MIENNMKWKTSVAEFRGYTKAKLEDLGKDLVELKDSIVQFSEHMEIITNNQNKKINKINGKVAVLAATISIVVSITLLILSKLLS